MRIGLGALTTVVMLGTGFAADAAVRHFSATFTGLTNQNGAFEALGVTPGTNQMTLYWSFDTDAAPLAAPIVRSQYDYVYLPYDSFRLEIDNIVLHGATSSSTADYVRIQNGKAPFYYDNFQIYSGTDQAAPNGVTLDYFQYLVDSSDNTILNSLMHPSSAELDELGASYENATLGIRKNDGGFAYITSGTGSVAEIDVVPLPAGLPLLGSALLLLAGLRRSRTAQR